jgi:hypothetical protein
VGTIEWGLKSLASGMMGTRNMSVEDDSLLVKKQG